MRMSFAGLLKQPKDSEPTPTLEELLCEDSETHSAEREAVEDVKKILQELREEFENSKE